jgi:beta-glucanase (GH16 family)
MSLTDFNNKYRTTQPWGNYHPNDLSQWYDPAGVSLNRTGNNSGLNLCVTNNTLDVSTYMVNVVLENNQAPVTIQHGVGLVTSKDVFGIGIYECNVILPVGKELWPAFWLTGSVTWPPEIDILEGATNNTNTYGRNLTSTIHCGNNGTNQFGLAGNRHGYFIDTTKVIKLQCWWTKDFIKIYYNGFLATIMTNKNNMVWFNQDMMVVINTALEEVITGPVTVTPFVIQNFKFYKCN